MGEGPCSLDEAETARGVLAFACSLLDDNDDADDTAACGGAPILGLRSSLIEVDRGILDCVALPLITEGIDDDVDDDVADKPRILLEDPDSGIEVVVVWLPGRLLLSELTDRLSLCDGILVDGGEWRRPRTDWVLDNVVLVCRKWVFGMLEYGLFVLLVLLGLSSAGGCISIVVVVVVGKELASGISLFVAILDTLLLIVVLEALRCMDIVEALRPSSIGSLVLQTERGLLPRPLPPSLLGVKDLLSS